jgi:2,4-dienoyl-CoA reductase-like NADH-dependent reductase (Old Yellow Enzyme family)
MTSYFKPLPFASNFPGENTMKSLFDQTTINGMTLQNRLVRSATWEGMCDADGRPGEKLISLYRDLAHGGVGLIITGYTFVSPEGKQMPGKMGIHRDEFAETMKKMTHAVHDAGAKICIQLVHAGGQTDTANAGQRPMAPSSIKTDQYPEVPAEMSRKDISAVIAAFQYGARRAQKWGFDAIQIHGAHGYLINQFLSPMTNRRQDEYGGPIENRCRFLLEVYEAIRSEVGPKFPVMIKLNGSDNLNGGFTIEEAVFAAKILDKAGIDCIEISGGTPASGDWNPVRTKIDSQEKEAYNLPLARQIKVAVTCPIMVVGGFRSFTVAEKTIRDSSDYISMARPFIREPGLAQRWQTGDRSPARCISCNGCFKPGLKEGGIYCVIEKKEQEKK